MLQSSGLSPVQQVIPVLPTWKIVNETNDSNEKDRIKVVFFNVLANCLTDTNFENTPSEVLKWEIRSKRLLETIDGIGEGERSESSHDVLSLTEIDADLLETFWRPELEKRGLQICY